jgi:hypothetical protein
MRVCYLAGMVATLVAGFVISRTFRLQTGSGLVPPVEPTTFEMGMLPKI